MPEQRCRRKMNLRTLCHALSPITWNMVSVCRPTLKLTRGYTLRIKREVAQAIHIPIEFHRSTNQNAENYCERQGQPTVKAGLTAMVLTAVVRKSGRDADLMPDAWTG